MLKGQSDASSFDNDICYISVYNAELGNLYCHHDILLGSFPLAVEWMDYDLRDGTAGETCFCSIPEVVYNCYSFPGHCSKTTAVYIVLNTFVSMLKYEVFPDIFALNQVIYLTHSKFHALS